MALTVQGKYYEDFELTQSFNHHWGRTLQDSDNLHFSLSFLFFHPIYFNVEVAKQRGYKGIPVNPFLVLTTVMGLSVEDLSETGGKGAFLGIDEVHFYKDVYPGDTIYSRSVVLSKRLSNSQPGVGILTWKTEGYNSENEVVCDFIRSNMVGLRNA